MAMLKRQFRSTVRPNQCSLDVCTPRSVPTRETPLDRLQSPSPPLGFSSPQRAPARIAHRVYQDGVNHATLSKEFPLNCAFTVRCPDEWGQSIRPLKPRIGRQMDAQARDRYSREKFLAYIHARSAHALRCIHWRSANPLRDDILRRVTGFPEWTRGPAS